MYKLQYKLEGNPVIQENNFSSLYDLIAELKTNFNSGYLQNIDQIVCALYSSKEQEISVLVTILDHLKYELKGDLKDQAIQRLTYLKMAI